MLGGSPAAETLARLAPEVGWRVARELRSDAEAVVVATMGHGDEEALAAVLERGTGYVGLVASARRAATVLESLRALGLDEEALARVRSPAGLDLGPSTQAEIAVAVLAELVAWRHSRAVVPSVPDVAVDPVCGMEVAVGSAKETAVHDGQHVLLLRRRLPEPVRGRPGALRAGRAVLRLENSFEVSATPEEAWGLLMDVPRVIPCMPGAELVETVDESNWKARMRVKIGPISLSFLTDVNREAVDKATSSVRLAAQAREERGRGAANATIESWLDAAEGKTKVTTVTDLRLSGAAAQYGRGLVQDITAQLLKSFADCLEQQLTSAEDGSGAPAPAQEVRPVSGIRLGLNALRSSLARLGRRVLRRPPP